MKYFLLHYISFVVLQMLFTRRPRGFMGLKCYTPGGYPLICYLPYKALKGLLGPVRAFRHSEATQDGRSLAPKMAPRWLRKGLYKVLDALFEALRALQGSQRLQVSVSNLY